MPILFSGEVPVHYGFMYFSPDGNVGSELIEARVGQANGLCGARVEGILSLVTGLHTGNVSVVVEWLDSEPPVDQEWDDVVEVSFEVTQSTMVLSAFEAFFPVTFPATGLHRARFSVSGMDAGRDLDTASLGPDKYLLQMWPANQAADIVVKQTSATAAHWHAVASRPGPA